MSFDSFYSGSGDEWADNKRDSARGNGHQQNVYWAEQKQRGKYTHDC